MFEGMSNSIGRQRKQDRKQGEVKEDTGLSVCGTMMPHPQGIVSYTVTLMHLKRCLGVERHPSVREVTGLPMEFV